MDQLDPTREIIVEAIAMLEHAIEDVIARLGPRNSRADIAGAYAFSNARFPKLFAPREI